MNGSSRRPAGNALVRWLPRLERLEARETPAVTVGLSQVANWTELGPNVISDGQTRGIVAPDPNGGSVDNPVIGAVSALAPHPTDATIMFAAGVNGGVWRTTTAHLASPIWEPISDSVASLSVSDMYLNPDNPAQLLVGIGGTADGADVDGSGVVRGELVGLLYTENALDPIPTWTIINNGLANKNITNVYLRSPVGIAPNIVPGYMLVATDAGLYRSDNGGQTFTNVYTATTNNGVSYFTRTFAEGVYDLAENPRLRNQFYVATKPGGAQAREVWRTDDGGLTWGTVTDPQMQLNDRTVNVQLSVRDIGASDNQVYVAVSNNNPAVGSSEQSTPGVVEPFTGIPLRYGWAGHTGVLSSVTWSTNQGGNWTRMDAPRQFTNPLNIVAVDATGTVTITTGTPGGPGAPHRMQTDDLVYIDQIFDVPPPATPPTPPTPPSEILEGYWTITVTGPYTFTLDGASFTGATDLTFGNPDANWRRVVGATPGENGEFLQVLASRTSQELVYLGGDMSQWNFFSTQGPTSFTGSYWEGNRFADPLGLGATRSNSNQWSTLTDTGTNNNNTGRTAPGADTREMLYDANGTLWVGTGSGVFRRNNLNGSGNWNSANGNLRLGQFWSTSYDGFTNTAIGAMQDTGQTEQNPTGLGWRSLVGTNDRNDLYDQENAYTSFVDNSQSFNPNPLLRRSVRYTLGSSFMNVTRTVTDPNGSTTGQLFFGSPSNPTGQFSGINPADLAVTNNNSIVLALNANDQRRGVYGLNNVYEDSDPNGLTGRIVNNVTPQGMTGLVRAMAYGGKRIINNVSTNFNQVLWIGTSTGQLFIRGEFGITFQLRPTGGTGAITDIELDPDDWRHAFVLQGNRVYETTDGGVTFADVSANLSTPADPLTGLPTGTGLTTQVRTIALYDPNPGTTNGGVTLLAGGRGGVFRLASSICGTVNAWAEYGVGLPNTVVQDLEVTGSRLLAGTFGRGAWVVDDVAPTLNNTIYLDIDGDAAANTIRIEADPLNPNGVIVDDGLGNRQAFTFGQFTAIRVTANGGADTVHIDSNGATAGGLANFVNYPIEVYAGGDAGDTVVINAESATAAVRATVTGTTVGAGAGDTLFGGCGSVIYAGLENGAVVINTGTGNDVFVVDAGTLAKATVLNAGGGNDNTYVYLAAGASGSVYVNDTDGTDAATVYVPAGQTAVADTQNRRVGVGGMNLLYGAGVDSVLIDGLGAGANLSWTGTPNSETVFLMQDPLIPATWSQLLSPNNTIRFHNLNTVWVSTLGGADGLVVDSNGPAAGGSTKFVTYAVVANLGGDAGDLLEINDSSTTANTRAEITATTIGADSSTNNLFGNAGALTYFGLAGGGARLFTGSGNDLLVFDAATALTAEVNFGGGAGDELWVNGTAGNDSVTIRGTSVLANALNVVAATGVDQFTVYGNGGLDTLTDVGSTGSDTLGVNQTGPLGGLLTGFPVPARYEGVEALSVNGGGGTDSLYWVDYTFTVYGTPTAPDTGLVYTPTGPLSGELRVNSGQVTTTRFSNVAGTFQVHGDPTGDGTRDVIAVNGLSDGDLGVASGSDNITATDAGVSITNASVGGLRGVTFALSPTGQSSLSTVYVRAGNEAGQGDYVSATTTTRTNLILDGGNPTSAPGDFIAITTQGQAQSAFVNDATLGPPHTRITDRVTGGAVGHLNFEGSSATFISPITGEPVSSFNPPIARLFAVATDAGVPTQVKVYNADGSERFAFLPFGGFTGGARVAVGDVTGDGTYDIVVSAGPGAAPHVKVYDGLTGAEVQSFFAYAPTFNGGVSVAVGYFNSDGYADIVIGAGAGGGPHVKVIDGQTQAELQSFFAFAPTFSNGVNVAAGDFGGDGTADIVVGAGAGGGPHVRVFDGRTGAEMQSFFAFAPNFTGGVNVAAGDITGDGRADVIAGAGQGGSAHVVVFDGATGGGPIRSFIVNDPSIPGQPPINVTSGVRVSAADLDGDGLAEVIAGRGPGSRPFAQFLRVSARNGTEVLPTLDTLLAVNVFGDGYSNGIYVGG